VPQAFVPEEDMGYFIVQVQAPAGASLEYTAGIARQAEQIILADPDVLTLFSVMGFSFSGAAPNQGTMFVRLKPFDERRGAAHSVRAVLNRLSGPLFGLPGAIVAGFAPPAIPGLSRFGGFEFQVLDQTGTDVDGARGRHAGADTGGQRVGPRAGPLQPVHRQRSPAPGDDRPGARAGARAAPQRDHQRHADPARRPST
jgi:multidrug efflux pump subunit AcrB